MTLEPLKKVVIAALEELKTVDIKVLDVQGIASFTDLMIIASGTSTRQVKALVRRGDLVVGLSTSGKSANVLQGVLAAKAKGALTMGFSGSSGGELKDLVDYCFHAPSDNQTCIQEAHMTVWHAICEIVEATLFTG